MQVSLLCKRQWLGDAGDTGRQGEVESKEDSTMGDS
jgi:hypothetical protein